MIYKSTKIVVHLICWLPLTYLFYGIFHPRVLGADPQEYVLHLLGFWALIFLLVGLSVSPLRKLFKLPILVKFRRMFGLYAFFYVALHIIIFFLFYLESNLALLGDEIIERPYIAIGMLATLMLIPLVITSTKSMQRRLGSRWKKLHKMVIPISILAITHFLWQSKSDLNEPLIYAVWLLFVLVYRYWPRRSVSHN